MIANAVFIILLAHLLLVHPLRARGPPYRGGPTAYRAPNAGSIRERRSGEERGVDAGP